MLAVLPAVLSRCCPFPVHGDSYCHESKGGRAALKVKTIFAGAVFRFRFTSYQLQLSGCVHTREDSPMSGDQIP